MELPDTRRNFLQSAAWAAAGLTGTVTLAGQTAPQSNAPGRGQGPGRENSGGPKSAPGSPPQPASELQVPKMKFGNAEISRLIAASESATLIMPTGLRTAPASRTRADGERVVVAGVEKVTEGAKVE